VVAELYPDETTLIKPGDEIRIKIAGFENAPSDAMVTFVSPAYSNNSQVTLMRAALANPGLKFKPGMQAQVFYTHSSRRAVAIPMDAVIREERGAYVFVQTDHNTFARRVVRTGLEGAFVEIAAGLKEGDVVVVTGAYLLYSELKLKGWVEQGDGHVH
jgi:Cu(I)/Ag(I) efflux system membrane fusion protein